MRRFFSLIHEKFFSLIFARAKLRWLTVVAFTFAILLVVLVIVGSTNGIGKKVFTASVIPTTESSLVHSIAKTSSPASLAESNNHRAKSREPVRPKGNGNPSGNAVSAAQASPPENLKTIGRRVTLEQLRESNQPQQEKSPAQDNLPLIKTPAKLELMTPVRLT